jgi:segregation and condensation protein A
MPAEAEQTTDSPPTSEVPAGAQYSVQLPSFEGPLDLLLHLCQKHELNILDIPIGFITEKYLEYLAVMQLMNLDIASEYLVMAATLAHIKSKMLLPAPPPGQEDELAEEEEDPRESLIRRLLEYQKYKLAGEELQSRGVAGRDIFMRGMPVDEAVQTGLPPLAQVPLFSLVEAFQSVLSKSKVKISHDVVHERITLTDRINELVDILRVKKRIVFEEMFDGLATRFDLVITFLAILEMTKLRMTRLHQSEPMSPIYVEFSAQLEETSETTDTSEKPEPPATPEETVHGPSDTEPPPEMAGATDPPPPPVEGEGQLEGEGEPQREPDPLNTIPSPPLSDEDEDPK